MNRYLLIGIFYCSLVLNAQDINSLRKNLVLAVDDKSVCENMINALLKNKNSPVEQSYLGAYQTIWAKHVINPLSKLSTFKKGTKNIDQAVATDPEQIEIRFIRYSVQKNAPKFLGYSEALKKDEVFLINNHHKIASPALKQMIKNVLQ